MKPSDPQRSPEAEGLLIRLLAPAHRSRLRLLIMALVLFAWIAFLVGLYLETARNHHHSLPASEGIGVKQVDSVSETLDV